MFLLAPHQQSEVSPEVPRYQAALLPFVIHFTERRVEVWKNVGVYVHNLGRDVVDSGFCKGVRVKSFFPSLLFVRV